MQYRYLTLSSVLVVGMLALWACKKEKSREDEPPPSNCSYAPYTNGSVYNFEQVRGTDTSTFTITVAGDTTIGGQTYKKLQSDTATTYDRCENGNYYQIVKDISIDNYTADSIQSIYLKDYEITGTSWSDTVTVRQGADEQEVILKYTLIQNGVTKRIYDQEFANVMTVKMDAMVQILGNFVSIGTLATSYYAKDVGLIEIDRENDTTRLRSYNIQ